MNRTTVSLNCHKVKSEVSRHAPCEVSFQERALLCRAVGLLTLIAEDGIDDEIRTVVGNVRRDFSAVVCRELQ